MYVCKGSSDQFCPSVFHRHKAQKSPDLKIQALKYLYISAMKMLKAMKSCLFFASENLDTGHEHHKSSVFIGRHAYQPHLRSGSKASSKGGAEVNNCARKVLATFLKTMTT